MLFVLSSVAGPLGTGIILRVIEGRDYELMNLTVADDAVTLFCWEDRHPVINKPLYIACDMESRSLGSDWSWPILDFDLFALSGSIGSKN